MPASRVALSRLALAAALLLAGPAVGQEGGEHGGVPLPAAGTPPVPFAPVQANLFNYPGSLSNAWGDFDNDGDLDLAVSTKAGEVRLYRNDAGTFTSIGEAAGLPLKAHELRGLSWGDYDGDGLLDLLGGATDPKQPTLVFRNGGDGRFAEVSADIGLNFAGRSARQTSWVDIDNDGDLDLYAADRIGPNRVMMNNGGSFTQARAGEGISDTRATVGACWFDFDTDGDLDLFLANQSGDTDALWRNDGDTFVDVAAAAGVASPGRSKAAGGVGCAIGDYDNDGRLDLFVPSYGANGLYRNKGDGTFEDVSAKTGVSFVNHSVGAAWGDYDNDGWLDLSLMAYEGPAGEQVPTNALLHSESDGAGGRRFVNVLARDSVVNAGDHGVQWVDYDGDGLLDLSLTDGYGPTGGHPVFRNTLGVDVGRRSLSVLVLDAQGRFTRVGAEVRLRDAGGTVIATRQVGSGDGYNTQSALPAHFGLASMAPVSVEVTFLTPGGRRPVVQENVDPAAYAGKALIVREPAG
ncbi:CRTAC1 family protein [Croceibacterium sp. TMG7-5b_MA50]|uniref:CRTAC1 family protein n=1 Tax=Croceibacterium sp. TMG7-5b_MA50 TaxID=3121290 RepID=UPI0032215B08